MGSLFPSRQRAPYKIKKAEIEFFLKVARNKKKEFILDLGKIKQSLYVLLLIPCRVSPKYLKKNLKHWICVVLQRYRHCYRIKEVVIKERKKKPLEE